LSSELHDTIFIKSTNKKQNPKQSFWVFSLLVY
jgi:hypothetical protein